MPRLFIYRLGKHTHLFTSLKIISSLGVINMKIELLHHSLSFPIFAFKKVYTLCTITRLILKLLLYKIIIVFL